MCIAKACSTIFIGMALVLAGCTHHFPDENARDFYRQIDYSPDRRVHEEVCPLLELVRISENGVVVMRYTSNQPYLVYAAPGEYLRGECGNIAFKVVSIDSSRGTVTIEYLYSTTRPQI